MRKVVLSTEIKNKIISIQEEYDFKREIGGILIGKFDAESDCQIITDISFPYPSDRKGRFRFSRKSAGHQEYMDKLWEESGRTKAYLGEWHTHDQYYPTPSIIDRNTWKRISKRDNNFEQCFFLIVGRKYYTIWSVIDNKIQEIERSNWGGKE